MANLNHLTFTPLERPGPRCCHKNVPRSTDSDVDEAIPVPMIGTREGARAKKSVAFHVTPPSPNQSSEGQVVSPRMAHAKLVSYLENRTEHRLESMGGKIPEINESFFSSDTTNTSDSTTDDEDDRKSQNIKNLEPIERPRVNDNNDGSKRPLRTGFVSKALPKGSGYEMGMDKEVTFSDPETYTIQSTPTIIITKTDT